MTPTTPAASVIVRAKDEAADIERCLQLIRAQTVGVELIVVDSGSTDGTLEIAERYADQVLRIAPEDFTFGGALNTGAAAASAPIHVAVSAHCFLERDDWVQRATAHFAQPRVAGVFGSRLGMDGQPLTGPLTVAGPGARDVPYWGYSNHASAWRAEAWQALPIDEGLAACEDREWFWRALGHGWSFVADPVLWVSAGHRRDAGLRALYRRTRKEAAALAAITGHDGYDARAAMHEWWADIPAGSRWPRPVQRLNYLRATEIAGRWAGERQARQGAGGGRGSRTRG
jgi:rhamnosyltransferase